LIEVEDIMLLIEVEHSLTDTHPAILFLIEPS